MNLPPQGNNLRSEGYHFSTLKVEAQSTPNMSLRVSAGLMWVNGKTAVEYAGGNTAAFISPPANAKWDLLVLRHNGTLDIIQGAESSNPIFPECPAKCFPLAAVYLKSTDSAITYDMVNDVRPAFNISVQSHAELGGNDSLDIHPISAIEDLTAQLNDRYNTTAVDNLVANKANITGTTEEYFVLNQDYMGTPASNCGLQVERGTENNAVLRYNETVNVWQYTNDGITWVDLSNTGSTMTGAAIKTAYETEPDTNAFTDADQAKLGSVEAGASADQTGSEIKTLYEAVADTNVFDDAAQLKLASIENNATDNQTGAEIKLAYEAEANTNAFSDAQVTKLAGIETGATTDMTGSEIKSLYEAQADTNAFDDAEQTKLDNIEPLATADMTGAEIKTAYESQVDTNAFTDGLAVKLNAIEALATVDQTGAEIKTAYEAELDTNAYNDAAVAKLAAIELLATADQTGAEIKTLYEAEANSNAYDDAAVAKLGGIEPNATIDQTGSEIKALYEAEVNAFTDADKTKLTGIEVGATADQTGAEIKTAYEAEADTNAYDDAAVISVAKIDQNGATAARPGTPATGELFFDTTLGTPIWYDGAGWVDSSGVAA